MSVDKFGTSNALGPSIVLKTTERNRRQAICAGLIASTIVTVDCGDEECACATSQAAEGAASASPANDGTAQAEMPTGNGVNYSLAPVITSLPSEPKIAVANLPADLAIEDVLVDAVSQPDQLVDLDDADEGLRSPRLSRANRRSASNQNGSSKEDLITEEVIALPETDQFDVQLQVGKASPTKERPSTKSPILQDEYIAFGVNGL